MELIIGHFYTYKKHKRRWTVTFEGFTDKDGLVIVRDTANHLIHYVNLNSLRHNKRLTLEKKLCGYRG